MTAEDKNHLLDLLTESHAATRATVEGIDPELCVYPDTGWRVRDIIGHIATWERQSAMSLQAFESGKDYSIPGLDEDNFNEQTVLEQRELTAQQIFLEWEQAQKVFRKAVEDMPLEKFPGDLLYPWGDERGSIAQLVAFLIDHDAEHRDEIVKAIQTSNEV
jgi:hypothetical protein